jgi:Tfp pilus assembly protein PilX
MSIHRTTRQRGAALVVGLILLAIITLLAVVGMNIANGELASATSEQLRMRAFRAAESGLEHALIEVKKRPAQPGYVKTEPAVGVTGSPIDPVGGGALDKYEATYKYEDEGQTVAGFSSNFSAFHFTLTVKGTSARGTNTTDQYSLKGLAAALKQLETACK